METTVPYRACIAVLLALWMTGAAADDRAEYEKRAMARDKSAFLALDLDKDGVVTRDEALPDLNFGPRFNDMDIDRDGAVTAAELERYLQRRFQPDAGSITADNR